MSYLRQALHIVALPLILLGIWFLATLDGASFFVPTPQLLVETFSTTWTAERFLGDVFPSLGRLFIGIVLSIALILMVISEMFASTEGLGFTIVQFQRTFAIPEMWTGIVLLGLIGVLLSFIFQITERWVLGWYHGLREIEQSA